ncbi:hypothetical protein NHX12_027069 [Muraenolepis orangiensis]|uniref:Uncharacterized protein n=1 Tax=Muraenolepis orangiensis TaxID=630683 RepID=A0A9Q0EES5_9TELE|nr:hypothetical protein NHX12_027069 [Muraenolepis orangiensis]
MCKGICYLDSDDNHLRGGEPGARPVIGAGSSADSDSDSQTQPGGRRLRGKPVEDSKVEEKKNVIVRLLSELVADQKVAMEAEKEVALGKRPAARPLAGPAPKRRQCQGTKCLGNKTVDNCFGCKRRVCGTCTTKTIRIKYCHHCCPVVKPRKVPTGNRQTK